MELSFGNNIGSATKNGLSMGSYDLGTVQNSSLSGASAPSTVGSAMPDVTVQTPQVGGGPGGDGPGAGGNFWSKDGGAGMILGGVQVLGSLWNSYNQHKMAKEQMSFAREQWDMNLKNQTQIYNTALEDRIRSRHHTEGKGSGATDKYLEKHSL